MYFNDAQVMVKSCSHSSLTQDIEREFERFGPIQRSWRPQKFHGGYCFIQFRNEKSARKCLTSGAQITVGGRRLVIENQLKYQWNGLRPTVVNCASGKDSGAPAPGQPRNQKDWFEFIRNFIGDKQVTKIDLGHHISSQNWSVSPTYRNLRSLLAEATKLGVIKFLANDYMVLASRKPLKVASVANSAPSLAQGDVHVNAGPYNPEDWVCPVCDFRNQKDRTDCKLCIARKYHAKSKMAEKTPFFDIYCMNVDYTSTLKDTKAFFEQKLGRISDFQMPRKGVAFCTMASAADARRAVELRQFKYKNRTVFLEASISALDRGKTFDCAVCSFVNPIRSRVCYECGASRVKPVEEAPKPKLKQTPKPVWEEPKTAPKPSQPVEEEPTGLPFCLVCVRQFKSRAALIEHETNDRGHEQRVKEDLERAKMERLRAEEFYKSQRDQAWRQQRVEAPNPPLQTQPVVVEKAPVGSKSASDSSNSCTACGSSNLPGYRFCNSCGTEAKKSKPVVAPTSPRSSFPPVSRFAAMGRTEADADDDDKKNDNDSAGAVALRSLDDILSEVNLLLYLDPLRRANVIEPVKSITNAQFDAAKVKPFHRTKILRVVNN